MFNFLVKTFTIFTVFLPVNLLADYEVYEEDLEPSKNRFFISKANYDEQVRDKKGVITLCFKEQDGDYDSTALVFETFSRSVPTEISLNMLYYGQSDGCTQYGCGGNKRIEKHEHNNTLQLMHRAKYKINNSPDREVLSKYKTYASWSISDKILKDILTEEQNRIDKAAQQNNNFNLGFYYTCVKYASEVMRNANLTVDFHWWRPDTPDHLRSLIDDRGVNPEIMVKKN